MKWWLDDRLYQLNVLASCASLQVQAAHSATSQDSEQDVERAISVQLLYKSESSASLKSDSHFSKIYTETVYLLQILSKDFDDSHFHRQSEII